MEEEGRQADVLFWQRQAFPMRWQNWLVCWEGAAEGQVEGRGCRWARMYMEKPSTQVEGDEYLGGWRTEADSHGFPGFHESGHASNLPGGADSLAWSAEFGEPVSDIPAMRPNEWFRAILGCELTNLFKWQHFKEGQLSYRAEGVA